MSAIEVGDYVTRKGPEGGILRVTEVRESGWVSAKPMFPCNYSAASRKVENWESIRGMAALELRLIGLNIAYAQRAIGISMAEAMENFAAAAEKLKWDADQ